MNINSLQNMKMHHLYYDKITALELKGIAIFFMVTFHLFCPNHNTYNIPDISLSYTGVDKLLGIFCNRTVPIYIFMTGYALAMRPPVYNDILRKVQFLYGRIWLLSLLFIPILLFSGKICWSYSQLLHTIVLGDGYMRVWWYASFYIMILVLFYLYKTLIPVPIRNYTSLILVPLTVLAYYCIDDKIILPFYLNRFIKFSVYLIIGICMYEYKIFERVKTNFFISFVLVLLIFALDTLIKNDLLYRTYRIISFPLLMISFADICNHTRIANVCMLLGKHSTNIWLIHGFFFYVAEFIYYPHYFIFVLMQFLFVSLICSHIFNLLCKYSIDKIRFNKCRKNP